MPPIIGEGPLAVEDGDEGVHDDREMIPKLATVLVRLCAVVFTPI